MSQDAPDLEGVLPLWEYTFQTNDKRRKDAVRSFSELRRGRFARSAMIGTAWLILISAIVLIIWFCAAAIVGLQYIAQYVISAEAVAVLGPAAMATLYLLVVRGIVGYFKKKAKDKEIGEVAASIRIFDGHLVEYSDEGSTKVKKIERVYFGKEYLFFLIDGGARFVYLPRSLVAANVFERMETWAAEPPL